MDGKSRLGSRSVLDELNQSKKSNDNYLAVEYSQEPDRSHDDMSILGQLVNGNKRVRLDSRDASSRIVKTSERFIVDQANPHYQLPFEFTEQEIQEAFNTIDFHKNEFITTEEISFFLDILGEKATEAEINEMIEMLDIQGTRKVYFPEFKLMATGQALSPIGVAYPPAIRLLNQKNLSKFSNKETLSKISTANKRKQEIGFISEKEEDEEEKIGNTGKLGRNKKPIVNKIFIIQESIQNSNLQISDAIKKMKRKKLKVVDDCNFDYFCEIVLGEYRQSFKPTFDKLLEPGKTTLNLREFLINCVSLNGWSNLEKCRVSFEIMDHEKTNQIFFDDIVNILDVMIY